MNKSFHGKAGAIEAAARMQEATPKVFEEIPTHAQVRLRTANNEVRFEGTVFAPVVVGGKITIQEKNEDIIPYPKNGKITKVEKMKKEEWEKTWAHLNTTEGAPDHTEKEFFRVFYVDVKEPLDSSVTNVCWIEVMHTDA